MNRHMKWYTGNVIIEKLINPALLINDAEMKNKYVIKYMYLDQVHEVTRGDLIGHLIDLNKLDFILTVESVKNLISESLFAMKMKHPVIQDDFEFFLNMVWHKHPSTYIPRGTISGYGVYNTVRSYEMFRMVQDWILYLRSITGYNRLVISDMLENYWKRLHSKSRKELSLEESLVLKHDLDIFVEKELHDIIYNSMIFNNETALDKNFMIMMHNSTFSRMGTFELAVLKNPYTKNFEFSFNLAFEIEEFPSGKTVISRYKARRLLHEWTARKYPNYLQFKTRI